MDFLLVISQMAMRHFYYYINEIPIADFHEQKRGLFGFNAKEVIEREILNQKGNETKNKKKDAEIPI